MSSFYERVAEDVFAKIPEGAEVSVSFVEVAGDKCHDLLNCFSPVELLQVAGSGFQAYPAVEPVVRSADALVSLIRYGCGIRSTAATGVHDSSSRSHAVLRVYIRTTGSGGKKKEGVLSLIDLAGAS